VWEGGGGRGRKRVRWSWWGCVKRFCAVPLREHVKFSRATSVFSVVGIENARSNRPSTTAWRPAPSCGMSRAPRRLPVLSFPRRVSLRKRVEVSPNRDGSKIKSRLFYLLVQGVVSERTTPAVDLGASEDTPSSDVRWKTRSADHGDDVFLGQRDACSRNDTEEIF
jgi:hypothetical protein